MSVRKRGERWIVDIDFEHPDGARERIRKVSPVQTKRGAEAYEREVRQALLSGTYNGKEEESKQVVTLTEFAKEFMETYSRNNNKPSEIRNKESALRVHIVPYFGAQRLDQIGERDIERYKAKLLQSGLSPKSINNYLACLRRLFAVAKEWGVIERVPDVKWLKVPPQSFDFLDFDETDAIIDGAEDKWRAMIVVALKTGLRQGELWELRRSDVVQNVGLLRVSRSNFRGQITATKSGKAREVPLCDTAREALIAQLASHKHELVFCEKDGTPINALHCRRPLYRACEAAGLREIGWHVLRHTFASHLVMRGAPLKVVQELLGHGSMAMTLRYSHLSPEAKQSAIHLLDSSGTMAAQKTGEFCNSPVFQGENGRGDWI